MALTRDAWLNVEADLLAKAKQHNRTRDLSTSSSQATLGVVTSAKNGLLNNSIYPSGIALTDKKRCTTGKNGNSYYQNSCKW